jgi:hypothetical protein
MVGPPPVGSASYTFHPYSSSCKISQGCVNSRYGVGAVCGRLGRTAKVDRIA